MFAMRRKYHSPANPTKNHPGDAAIALLKAGAEADKRDVDGLLAIEVAPGADVGFPHSPSPTYSSTHIPLRTYILLTTSNQNQVRRYIERKAEEEGIEL